MPFRHLHTPRRARRSTRKATRRNSSSQSMTPSEYTSARVSTASGESSACSGLM
jgi:hypothetical protein